MKPASSEKVEWIESQEAEEAIEKLVEDIRRRPALDIQWVWPNPALNVIDCVLSIHTNYERVVLPRVRKFAKERPDITTLLALRDRIRTYCTPYDFGVADLDYRSEGRMNLLLAVTERLIERTSEHTNLTEWANKAELGGEVDFKVHGFGPAGFQYLRILLGAQTFKPDVHILAHIKAVTGLSPAPNDAVRLMQEAVVRTGVVARDLDHTIWRERAGATFTAP